MIERRRIVLEQPVCKRRMPTQQLNSPWPFPLSVDPTGTTVRNLPPLPKPKRARATKSVKDSTEAARVLIKTLP